MIWEEKRVTQLVNQDFPTLLSVGRRERNSVISAAYSQEVMDMNQYITSIYCYKYKDIQEAFDNYVKEGGMSGSYLYKTQEDKYKYIESMH